MAVINMRMPELEENNGPVQLTDTAPYLYRQAPIITEKLSDKLIGGTVAVNQFLQNSNVANASGKHGLTFTKGNDGFSYTLTGTYVYTSGDRNIYCYTYSPSIPVIAGHVYLVTTTSKYFQPYLYGVTWSMARSYINNTPTGGVIGRASTSGNINMSTHCGSNIPNNTDINETITENLIDLTQMFGAAIADYLYNLETATPGAGVAWFRNLFPDDYYAYNAGELISVKTSAHKTVGKNLAVTPYDIAKPSWYMSSWLGTTIDGDWINQQGYSISIGGFGGVCFYNLHKGTYTFSMDVDATNAVDQKYANTMLVKYKGESSYTQTSLYNQIAQKFSRTFTLEKDAECVAFRTTSGGNSSTAVVRYTNIQLEYGNTATDYKPYDEHVYPLDNDLELRGIPKLDAENNLYYDGDIYESNGTVTRRYGYIEYDGSSDEDWYTYEPSNYDSFCFVISNTNKVRKGLSSVCNEFVNVENAWGAGGNGIYRVYSDHVSLDRWYFRQPNSAVTTIGEWRTWLSENPIRLVYELATPTTETADPFTDPQDSGYTEQYIDDRAVPVPVGHETTYFDMIQNVVIPMVLPMYDDAGAVVIPMALPFDTTQEE